jgi:hypothetical protein
VVFSRRLIPSYAGLALVALVSLLSMAFVVSVTLVDVDDMSFAVSGRVFFSLLAALAALNLIGFQFVPSEFMELRALLVTIVLVAACVEHIISVRGVRTVSLF